VASAYGWVTIAILSMVKRAHPLYSNIERMDGIAESSVVEIVTFRVD
jgi:hypothetical protein